eukprot:UN04465
MHSFHSLYALFRQQFCRYIYIHFPTFFNIIFCYDTNGNEAVPQIIITNTHQSFRNNLKKQNIEFSTPLISTTANNKCDGELDNDDKENEKIKNRKSEVKYNNTQRTLTLIYGKRNVHNFYDFLMNNMHRLCLSNKKCHDLALLFCDEMFLNSKCCLIEMTKNLSGYTERKKDKMYTMQLNGYILPNVYHKLVHLLQ